MKVRVLFFGATAEAAGARSMEVDALPNSTSRAVFDRLLAEIPGLSAHKLLFSVNQEYSDGGDRLQAGDELAIFTAVSGG